MAAAASPSQPPQVPALPVFVLPDTSSDNEVEEFWKTYPIRLHEFNSKVKMYIRTKTSFKQNFERVDMQSSGVAWECSEDQEVTMARTIFETQKLRVVRSHFTEWYTAAHLDLSGPLGVINYKRREGSEDELSVNNDGTYNFQGVKLKILCFNFLETDRKHHGFLSSGYRIIFSPEGITDLCDDYVAIADALAGKIKVQLQFTYKHMKRNISFILPKNVDPEKVNTYVVWHGEDQVDEFYTDIPIKPDLVHFNDD